jgi:hypothetical protein
VEDDGEQSEIHGRMTHEQVDAVTEALLQASEPT